MPSPSALAARRFRKGDETRLASPCNIWAKALGDVKTLAKVRAGTKIKVTHDWMSGGRLGAA